LDLPLGETDSIEPAAVMVNILGVSDSKNFMDNYQQVMSNFPEIKIHSYAKAPRNGRKLGHITVVGQNLDTCLQTAEAARNQLNK
jgi:5-(carboxyamino)imidazole ribonucleotide synthase